MFSHRFLRWLPILLALQPAVFAQKAAEKDPVFIIGVSIPLHLLQAKLMPRVANAKLEPLEDLIESDSGLPSDLQVDSSETLLKKLSEGKIHLAIMPGVEYAWHGRKSSTAVPLLTLGKPNANLRACIIMKADAAYTGIQDLKTKTIAFPRRNEYFVHLFVNSLVTRAGGNPLLYFQLRLSPANTDSAIESVLSDEAHAVILNEQAWHVYRERKPQRAQKLKVVARSPAFPPPIALYNPSVLSEAQAARLRAEMCHTDAKPLARQTLNFYRIDRFAPFSEEYDQLVESILKEYPKPVSLVPMFKKTVNEKTEKDK